MEIDFHCEACGDECAREPGEWPALGFIHPDPYLLLGPTERAQAEVSTDWCVIHRALGTEFYLRTCLSIPILDEPGRTLEYGPWAALDGPDADEVSAHWLDASHRATYVGELATTIPGYEEEGPLAVQLRTRGRLVARMIPDPRSGHRLARDAMIGITREEAELRIRSMLLESFVHP